MLLSTFHFRNAKNNPEMAALFQTITKDCRLNPCCLALLEANKLIQLGVSTEQEEPKKEKKETKQKKATDAFAGFKELRQEAP